MIEIYVKHHGWRKYPKGSKVKFDDIELDELLLAQQNGMIKISKMPNVIENDVNDKLERKIKGFENIEENDITSEE